ncbi:hypothetical protein Pelo_4019 [Pelomyxa schiedti]|nr:hypothetical protein Pelo_4019 [Pelomyxa schiedti]
MSWCACESSHQHSNSSQCASSDIVTLQCGHRVCMPCADRMTVTTATAPSPSPSPSPSTSTSCGSATASIQAEPLCGARGTNQGQPTLSRLTCCACGRVTLLPRDVGPAALLVDTSAEEGIAVRAITRYCGGDYAGCLELCGSMLNRAGISFSPQQIANCKQLPTTSTTTGRRVVSDAIALLLLRYVWAMQPDLFDKPILVDEPWTTFIKLCSRCSPSSHWFLWKVLTGLCPDTTSPPTNDLSSTALFLIGVLYSRGIGVAEDSAEGDRLYGLNLRNHWCLHYFGIRFYHGDGDNLDFETEEDGPKAMSYFLKSTELGNPYAPYKLARCYQDATGVTNDQTEAVRYFRIADSRGCTWATTELVWCMQESLGGLTPDTPEEMRLLHRAAMTGSLLAQHHLGLYYEPQDLRESIRWHRLAASHGHPGSQDELDTILHPDDDASYSDTRSDVEATQSPGIDSFE